MPVSDLRQLKALEAENRHSTQIVAEQTLDNLTLKELLSKTSDVRDKETGGHALVTGLGDEVSLNISRLAAGEP